MFFLYFVKHNDSVLHIIRFVFPWWHATTLKKQWGLPGLSISIQAGLDKRQMWISKHWLCLVYKCRSEQILRSWEDIFPLLLQIYTGPYSDTHHKQRTFGSVVGRPVFVGTCRSGPRFMAPAWQWWVIKVYRWKFLQWQILHERKKKVITVSRQNSRYRHSYSYLPDSWFFFFFRMVFYQFIFC